MNTAPRAEHKRRLPGLDVVRASAILMVLIAHTIPGRGHAFLPEYLSGLFATLGVELFFVLSGFLIGGILIRDIERAPGRHVSPSLLLNFWKRRWFRTIPACFFFLCVHIILDRWLAPGFDAFSAALPFFIFLQNLLWPHPNFYQEYWSLATEEWFYLLFPILLCLIAVWKPRTSYLVLAGAIFFLVIPTVLRGTIDLHAGWDEGIRKVVLLRLDCLMYGVLGALFFWRFPGGWKRFARPAAVTGIVLLGTISVYFWNQFYSIGYSGFDRVFLLSLVPLSMALFLPFFSTGPFFDASQRSTSARRRFFSSSATYVSLISYSLYLCHGPCMQVVSQLWQDHIGPLSPSNRIPIIVIQWACFFGVAHLSYRFIEVPFLRLRDRNNSH